MTSTWSGRSSGSKPQAFGSTEDGLQEQGLLPGGGKPMGTYSNSYSRLWEVTMNFRHSSQRHSRYFIRNASSAG
jgi:hypothetical protein